MAEELWRPSLDLALHRNRLSAQSRYVQVATVRGDGRPAVRTLVFRGYLGETHRMAFATDVRSAKAREIESAPWVEACWYFTRTREQFRFAGPAALAGPKATEPLLVAARLQVWSELSEESRLGYTWPDPGRPRNLATDYATLAPAPDQPSDHFALLVLDVQEVDHLELNGNPQHRWRYTRRGQLWSAVEVNP